MSKGKMIFYSAKELAWIKTNRALPRRLAHRKFCEKFKRKDVDIDNYKALCTRRGWNTGRTGRFKKGVASWNEGKKFPPGRGGNHPNARKTQFKKGQEPHNTKYLGHERVTLDGYVEISVAKTNPHTGYNRRYVLKHRYLWEEKNGKLPVGTCLKCLDGNLQNTDPSNWKCIPRGALPFLNGHRGHDYSKIPDELKPAVLILAQVKHAKSNVMKNSGQTA